MPRRKHACEEKLKACGEVRSELKSKAQICRELAIQPTLLDRWLVRYDKYGLSAFKHDADTQIVDLNERVRELEGTIGRLYAENEFLKAALKKGASLRETKQK